MMTDYTQLEKIRLQKLEELRAEASVKTQVAQMYPPNAMMIARCVSAGR